MNDTIKIVIADDHPLVLDGLKSRLQRSNEVQVIGEATDGEQAIEVISETQPDVVLLDINMPNMNGIEAAQILQERFPDTKVLILSMHDDREYVLNLARAGVRGYVLKSAAFEELITAIKAVYMGAVYYSAGISSILMDESNKPDSSLTSREQTVLQLLSDGLTNKQMAHEMNISIRTVETHRRNIKRKLELNSTTELIRYAIDHGLSKLA
jgi:two-component system nitrate/nitrite response regulator NarL